MKFPKKPPPSRTFVSAFGSSYNSALLVVLSHKQMVLALQIVIPSNYNSIHVEMYGEICTPYKFS